MSTNSSSIGSRFALLALLACTALHGQTRVTHRPKFANAEGCAVSTLTCDGTPQQGTIATGDCTVADGTRYDKWQVYGNGGDEIIVTLDPLDSTLTDPFIDFEPPQPGAILTPFVIGTGTVTVKYILPLSGMWNINVGSNDVAGSGRYRLRAFCNRSTSTDPQNCEPQPLSCNQIWTWSVTPTSCKFSNSPSLYAPFEVYLATGDVLQLDLASDDFDPGVAVYRPEGNGNAVAGAFGYRFGYDAALAYRAPANGMYQIAAYDRTFGGNGEFSLAIACQSACTPVSIGSHPASKTLQGGPLSLAVTPLGTGPFTYQWYEGKPSDTGRPVSTSATLQLAAVPASTSYWVRVTNACGRADSLAAVITVVAPGKHHIAGH